MKFFKKISFAVLILVLIMPILSIFSACSETGKGSIIFEENGGSAVLDIEKMVGEKVTLPTPTKTNYTFVGWYLTPDFTGSAYNTTLMQKDDITLYAKWEIDFNSAHEIINWDSQNDSDISTAMNVGVGEYTIVLNKEVKDPLAVIAISENGGNSSVCDSIKVYDNNGNLINNISTTQGVWYSQSPITTVGKYLIKITTNKLCEISFRITDGEY